MDARRIADRIAWAGNRTARHTGIQTDAFRPAGPTKPLSTRNRYLRLPAVFSSSPAGFTQVAEHGDAVSFGHFDSSYTRPGDYLVQGSRVFFIASQEPLHPVMCVRTNMDLTIRRNIPSAGVGGAVYGGLNTDGSRTILEDWPASVLGMSTSGTSHAGLPWDRTLPQWTILLAPTEGILISAGDLVSDGAGLRAIIIMAERSFLGWRLIAREATA